MGFICSKLSLFLLVGIIIVHFILYLRLYIFMLFFLSRLALKRQRTYIDWTPIKNWGWEIDRDKLIFFWERETKFVWEKKPKLMVRHQRASSLSSINRTSISTYKRYNVCLTKPVADPIILLFFDNEIFFPFFTVKLGHINIKEFFYM